MYRIERLGRLLFLIKNFLDLDSSLMQLVPCVDIRQEIERLAQDIVSCVISRPDGYDLGAWRMESKLGSQVLGKLGNSDFVFSLPILPNRMCHPEKGYVRAVNGELCGRFINGEWLGDWYSNGIAETQNSTTMDAVRDAFIQNITQAVQKAGLIG